MPVKQFRQRPNPVPALQWTGENFDELRAFTGAFLCGGGKNPVWVAVPAGLGFWVDQWWWVIKSADGTYDTFPNELFKRIYEEIVELEDA